VPCIKNLKVSRLIRRSHLRGTPLHNHNIVVPYDRKGEHLILVTLHELVC
jgi:hypothetical protein